ncbi:MAG: efflux RND transporter periplasmic adaptor subunit [Hyphomicrobiaceae bacterium]
MRRSFTLAVVLLAVGAVAWFVYPASRRWPVFSHVGQWMALPAKDVTPAAEAPKGSAKGPGGRGAAIPVLAAVAVTAEMPIILSAPGTVEPFATVGVRPRVDGQIAEIAFKEGDEVRAGDVLFRLDDRLVKAQMRQAEANIARDRAALTDAEAILRRREALVTKSIVTEQATETQRSTVEALKAAIAAGEAQLEAQRTQLDYLTVLAPIPGRTGALKAELGSNVRAADTSSLVVINQTRPIAVTFSVPQGDIVNLRRALAVRAEATIRVGGERPIETRGTVTFIDNQVDKATGTLMGKIEVANEDEVLWPGQAVEVELVVERRPGYVAVPASAVLPSQQGMLVWVIGAEGSVKPRTVALARVIGPSAYLSDGLAAGERVVTDGQLRLSPGAVVTIREPRPAPRGKPGAEGGRAEPDKGGTGPAARDTPQQPAGPQRGRT